MLRLCLVVFAAVVGSGRSGAQVPPDAAIFVHVGVAKLWKGPVGEQLRAAKVAEFDRAVADLEAVTGLTPADVTSVTAHWPDLRTPTRGGDVFVDPFVVTLSLTKPIDAGRLVALAAMGCRASEDRVSYRFEKSVLTLKYPTFVPFRDGLARKFQEVTLDISDVLHPRLSVHAAAKPGVKAEAAGPQTPAIAAAATKDIVVGVNFAMLPPDLSGEPRHLRDEARPFVPLLKADFALLVGEVADGKLAVEARFRSTDAAVTRDCEKSLAAARTLLSALLEAGLKDAKDKSLAAVLAGLKPAVEAATTRVDGTDAVATLAVPTDLPFGPALGEAFGKKSIDAWSRTTTQNNLKQLGLALHSHHDAHNAFPPPAVTDKKGKPLLSWRVAVLPQIEQGVLYERFKMDEAWDSEHNLKAMKDNPMPAVFALPGVTLPGDKETYFRVFVGDGAAFEPLKALRITAFTDGTSNTLLVATAAKSVPWTKPDELAFDPKATEADLKKLLRLDGGGCNVLLADGSARYLPSTIAIATLKALITRGGGEVLNLD